MANLLARSCKLFKATYIHHMYIEFSSQPCAAATNPHGPAPAVALPGQQCGQWAVWTVEKCFKKLFATVHLSSKPTELV